MPKAQPKVEGSGPGLEAIEVLRDAGMVDTDGHAVVEIRSASVAELSEVRTFEDALRLATSIYGELIPSFDLGDGFVGVESKDELVGQPFIVMGWGLGWSDYGDDERFSILRVVTQDNRKLRFSDGGTGVHKTMMERFHGNPAEFQALVALGGLSKGEYTPRNQDGSPVVDGKGKPVLKAITYRFDVETLSLKD